MDENRKRLPDERTAISHEFKIGSYEGTLTIGLFEDGTPGEIFIRMAKQGSLVRGLTDAIGLLTSFALQHGIPLEALVEKFERTRFDPQGYSGHPEIGYASSILDYVFRYLALRFLPNRQIGDARQPQTPPVAPVDPPRARPT